MQPITVKIDQPEATNFVLGQAHFIKFFLGEGFRPLNVLKTVVAFWPQRVAGDLVLARFGSFKSSPARCNMK